MIRGTTPTHTFRLSIDTNTITELRITYVQLGKTVVEKTEKNATMGEKSISLTLTQEESLEFRAGAAVEAQLKVLTNVGTVLASPVISLNVDKILNTEVLE